MNATSMRSAALLTIMITGAHAQSLSYKITAPNGSSAVFTVTKENSTNYYYKSLKETFEIIGKPTSAPNQESFKSISLQVINLKPIDSANERFSLLITYVNEKKIKTCTSIEGASYKEIQDTLMANEFYANSIRNANMISKTPKAYRLHPMDLLTDGSLNLSNITPDKQQNAAKPKNP